MADNLTNTVQAIDYSYTVYGATTGSGTTQQAIVANEILPANITFTKVISRQYATLGDSFTVTYTVGNQTGEILDSVEITDTLVGVTTFTQQSITNGTVTGNVVTMTTLPADGQEQTVQITYRIENTTVPSATQYSTKASAAISGGASPLVTKTATAELQINAAILTATKVVSPTGSILEGNVLTYTITITNTGNVDATIPAGKFVDSWTAGGFSTISISQPTRFAVDITNHTITSIDVITVAAGSNVQFTITGSALVP